MTKTLNASQLSEINRNLTLAMMGIRVKNRQHIEKALEILNGKVKNGETKSE